jgi:hypothetical protein
MSMATVTRRLSGLEKTIRRRTAPEHPALWALRRDPARTLTEAGIRPDQWQVSLLRSSFRRMLILASRQVGKSLTAGALALHAALANAGALVLILSPTLRQSSELFKDKILRLYGALGRPLQADTESALQLTLANGSRIVSLPGSEATIRGYASVSMLLIDEAARVPDELYRAVRPMLAVSGGRMVCLSSAYARQGFFFEEWENGGPSWHRVKVLGTECARIDPAFLEEERAALGPRVFAREYECQFSAADDAYFDFDSVRRALGSPNAEAPLF